MRYLFFLFIIAEVWCLRFVGRIFFTLVWHLPKSFLLSSPYCLPVGHGAATMSLFHRVLSFAMGCASPHDKPISLSSVSTVFPQVVLGLPLFLLPAGVHLRATLGILSCDIRKTSPSHLRRHFLISVFWYRPLLEILLGQNMLQILCRQLL